MTVADVKKERDQERWQVASRPCKADLAKIRTGRAHTGILDHIQVDYYGSPTALTAGRQRDPDRRAHHRRAAVGKEDGSARSRKRSASPTWA